MCIFSLFTSPYTSTHIPMNFSFLLYSEVSPGPRALMQQDVNKKFILKSYMMLENKITCLKGFPRGSWFSFTIHVLLVFNGKKDTMPVTVACSMTFDWEIYTVSLVPWEASSCSSVQAFDTVKEGQSRRVSLRL